MPASGSSSSIGASEPFATTAPASSSERYAQAQQGTAQAAADVCVDQLVHLLGRQRLPDTQAQRAFGLEPLPEAQSAEPAVLVVHGGDAARGREPHPGTHGLDVLVVGDLDV